MELPPRLSPNAMKKFLLIWAALCAWSVAVAASVEKIKNERVVAREVSLKAGESEVLSSGRPFVVVFLSDAKVETSVDWKPMTLTAKRGEVVYRETKNATLRAMDVGNSTEMALPS